MMHKALSIFSFNNSMLGYMKKILALIAVFFLFFIICKILNFAYFDISSSEFERVMWQSFHMQDNIDTVFLGSSHVYMGVDVFSADRITNGNTFDLATSSQKIQDAYYNLLYAKRKYNIKNVFLELYYDCSAGTAGEYDNINAMEVSWRTTDYMKPGLLRAQAIWNMNDMQHFADAYFPFVRYRNYLFDWAHINKQIERKRSDDYKNFIYRYNSWWSINDNGYAEINLERKGFYNTTIVYDDPVVTQRFSGKDLSIGTDAKKYLKKIIELCQNNNISITLFMTPVYDIELLSLENYDIYLDSVRDVASEYGIYVYDFNLIKREYLDLHLNDFSDVEHLNTQSAEKFTQALFDIINNNPEKYFYNSYAEKLCLEEPVLYGGYWLRESSVSDKRELMLAASNNEDMEFRVTLFRADEPDIIYETPEETLIQDFSNNRCLEIPCDEHGKVHVEWRLKNNRDKIDVLEFSY